MHIDLYDEIRYLPAGDRALVMEFGNTISAEIQSKIRSMMLVLTEHPVAGVVELVPAYRSLMIYYEPLITTWVELCAQLSRLEAGLSLFSLPKPRIIEIPTVYGGEYGPDLAYVAKYNHVAKEAVVKIHTSVNYLVYMLGFTPGFPYLGGLPEAIATPRQAVPRTIIPAGSVGIAGEQTGIYPIASPGGWQLIGRTPLQLYNPAVTPPVLLQAGDYLRFCQVSETEYRRISEQVESGQYKAVIRELE